MLFDARRERPCRLGVEFFWQARRHFSRVDLGSNHFTAPQPQQRRASGLSSHWTSAYEPPSLSGGLQLPYAIRTSRWSSLKSIVGILQDSL